MWQGRVEVDRARELLGAYATPRESCALRESPPAANTGRGVVAKLDSVLFLSSRQNRSALVASLAAGGCILLAWRSPFAFLPPLITCLMLHLDGRRRAFRRAESFERDYPALLLSLASAVRTGLDPFVALCKCEELFSDGSEMKSELRGLVRNVENGASEEESLARFAETIPHPDLKLFRSAFILARKEGASLAETLQRLARVTRQRQSFRRKVRSSVAMQKLSAIGITLCTLVIGLIQGLTNPEALRTAWASPLGSHAIVVGLCLVTSGLLWMLTLTRSRM